MCEVSAKYGFCDWGIPHCKKCGDHINEQSGPIVPSQQDSAG